VEIGVQKRQQLLLQTFGSTTWILYLHSALSRAIQSGKSAIIIWRRLR